MPEPVDLGYAFTLAPERAIEYFENKGYRISWNWFETFQEANARAFTVAKAMRLDVLQDIRGGVRDALANGTTFRTFRQQLEPLLRRKGWWGKQFVVNSQGVAEQVQLGSVRRLKTIYGTNLQTAYMAGRWQGQVENARERPYWMYIAIDDSRTRASHRRLHRRVFRWDDPIWQTIYPPNDWGCRCRIRALTEQQVRDMGLSVENSDGKLREELALVSKRTGELAPVSTYDLGGGSTFKTGAGWAYNPGAAHWQPDLDQYPYATAKQYIEGVVTGPPFTRFYSNTEAMVERVRAGQPGLGREALRSAVRPFTTNQAFPIAVVSERVRAALQAESQTVKLSQDSLVKQIINRTNQPVALASYQLLQTNIERARHIIQEDGLNHIYYFESAGTLYRAVVKRTRDGRELFLQTLHASNQRQLRRELEKGEEL